MLEIAKTIIRRPLLSVERVGLRWYQTHQTIDHLSYQSTSSNIQIETNPLTPNRNTSIKNIEFSYILICNKWVGGWGGAELRCELDATRRHSTELDGTRRRTPDHEIH